MSVSGSITESSYESHIYKPDVRHMRPYRPSAAPGNGINVCVCLLMLPCCCLKGLGCWHMQGVLPRSQRVSRTYSASYPLPPASMDRLSKLMSSCGNWHRQNSHTTQVQRLSKLFYCSGLAFVHSYTYNVQNQSRILWLLLQYFGLTFRHFEKEIFICKQLQTNT